jgi:hypothetical protein
VPEVLNITPAKAEAATAQTADAYAIQAATRPLAGFGAGAFMCEGAWAGSLLASPLISEMAASALSRVSPAFGVKGTPGIAAGQAQAGAFGAAYKASDVDVVQVDSVQQDTHNFIQTARLYPVTKGGVGPHPAREPEPV